MKKCAFLTMDDMGGYVSDDELAVEPLRALGWQVDFIPWKQPGVEWGAFDLVIPRTTWDYQKDVERFFRVLEQIDAATRLENPLPLVRWNLRKTYLQDLQDQGIQVVPSRCGDCLDAKLLEELFEDSRADELVIKPLISASADNTFRVQRIGGSRSELLSTFADRAFLSQPFMQGIVEEGEFSLLFLGGYYSHAVLKAPKSRDFRVQEEHGGSVQSVVAEPLLLENACAVVQHLQPKPLYARVDFVRATDGEFQLMELELIEPTLFLRMDAEAPQRFARAIDAS